MANLEKLTEQAKAHLGQDETILAGLLGAYECRVLGHNSVRNGALFATDCRLVFYAKKMAGYDLESFPYKHIASFEAGKSMLGPHIKFIGSGNTVAVKWIKGDLQPFVDIVNEHLHETIMQAPAADVSVVASDPTEALHRAKGLLDAGLITQEEYEAKRSNIMARL